jgi:hypothetical protein
MAYTREDPGRGRLQFIVIQIAFAVSCIIYAAIGFFLERGGELAIRHQELPWLPYLKNTLLILSVALFPLLRFLQRSFHSSLEKSSAISRGTPGPTRAVEALLPRYVILFTLAELPAVFGLVLYFLGSPLKTLLLLTGISLFYLAFMTPPEELFHRSLSTPEELN